MTNQPIPRAAISFADGWTPGDAAAVVAAIMRLDDKIAQAPEGEGRAITLYGAFVNEHGASMPAAWRLKALTPDGFATLVGPGAISTAAMVSLNVLLRLAAPEGTVRTTTTIAAPDGAEGEPATTSAAVPAAMEVRIEPMGSATLRAARAANRRSTRQADLDLVLSRLGEEPHRALEEQCR